jgi:hypothetical protein
VTGWLLLTAAFTGWLTALCYGIAWITWGHEPLTGHCTCPKEDE